MDEISKIKDSIKNKRTYKPIKINKFIFKIMATGVVTLAVLIGIKASSDFKTKFYKSVYQDSISFVAINNWYESTFGSSIPLKKLFKETTKPVFSESLKYMESSIYKDGVKLMVSENYLVPNINTGMVIFIGEKEEYGNTVIIEQVDGVEVSYSNISNVSVKLYDYVESGTPLGEVLNKELYLTFEKDGKYLSYEEFI